MLFHRFSVLRTRVSLSHHCWCHDIVEIHFHVSCSNLIVTRIDLLIMLSARPVFSRIRYTAVTSHNEWIIVSNSVLIFINKLYTKKERYIFSTTSQLFIVKRWTSRYVTEINFSAHCEYVSSLVRNMWLINTFSIIVIITNEIWTKSLSNEIPCAKA